MVSPSSPLAGMRSLTPEEHAAIWEPHRTAFGPRPARSRVASPLAEETSSPAAGEDTEPVSDLAARWNLAVTRHNQVKDAYADVIADPLNALTHAALFDVSNPRTAAFVLAYGEALDLASLHPTCPTQTRVVDEYAAKVRTCAMLWDDAFHQAALIGYEWLEAEQAAKARRAEALLRTSRDNAATPAERDLAAAKATELLRGLRGVRLPPETFAAIEAVSRPQLPRPAR